MRKVGKIVPLDECKIRALKFLSTLQPQSLAAPSQVAYAIWPEARNMRAQGAGLIGARVLRLLIDDGLVCWSSTRIGRFVDWEYQITATGRVQAKTLEAFGGLVDKS